MVVGFLVPDEWCLSRGLPLYGADCPGTFLGARGDRGQRREGRLRLQLGRIDAARSGQLLGESTCLDLSVTEPLQEPHMKL